MANQYKTQTEAILQIMGRNSSLKPADIIKERATTAKVAVEMLDSAMGHYASHKDDVRDELKSVVETINNIIGK